MIKTIHCLGSPNLVTVITRRTAPKKIRKLRKLLKLEISPPSNPALKLFTLKHIVLGSLVAFYITISGNICACN